MQRGTVRVWISVILLLSLVVLPSAALAQEGGVDKGDAVEEAVGEAADEAEKAADGAADAAEEAAEEKLQEGEIEPEPGKGDEVEPEPGTGDMEGGEAEASEGDMAGGEAAAGEGDMAGGEEAPEYLPVTGGSMQTTTSMVVLAVFGLLFAGAFATRRVERNR